MLRDVNPSSTLEASFEALNVKKFDLGFNVDPLFHKTSAQFDEGGARGERCELAALDSCPDCGCAEKQLSPNGSIEDRTSIACPSTVISIQHAFWM